MPGYVFLIVEVLFYFVVLKLFSSFEKLFLGRKPNHDFFPAIGKKPLDSLPQC